MKRQLVSGLMMAACLSLFWNCGSDSPSNTESCTGETCLDNNGGANGEPDGGQGGENNPGTSSQSQDQNQNGSSVSGTSSNSQGNGSSNSGTSSK